MAATTLFEQLFYPGFLEAIIRERVQQILFENTNEVEERKNVEIKVCEDRYAAVQKELVKAKQDISFLEAAKSHAQNTIACLEAAQAQATKDNAETIDLFGRLQQHFASRMYPSPPASATNLISPSSSPDFIHVTAPVPETDSNTASHEDMVIVEPLVPKGEPTGFTEVDSKKPAVVSGFGGWNVWSSFAITKGTTIDLTPTPPHDHVKATMEENESMPTKSKKLTKKEREKMKKDEEKRKKDEAAAKKREENEAKAAEEAATAAQAAEDAAARAAEEEAAAKQAAEEEAAQQAAEEEAKRRAEEEAAALAKQEEEKKAEEDDFGSWGGGWGATKTKGKGRKGNTKAQEDKKKAEADAKKAAEEEAKWKEEECKQAQAEADAAEAQRDCEWI
ncbi:hypothetical protein DL96DRAFT_1766923 [Flagelloscypha sp. PMI_526]|nr:hypothetical protein DL96DRAFT_1766923 [Flagelloscypha sp. PMI_526]